MADWLAIANRLAAVSELPILIREFHAVLKNDFQVNRSVLVAVTPDGRQLVTVNHDLQLSWDVADFNSPFAHVLHDGEQKVISAEQLIYWETDSCFISLLGDMHGQSRVVLTPLVIHSFGYKESDSIVAISLSVINAERWLDAIWQDSWKRYYTCFVELFGHHWQKLQQLELAAVTKGCLKESLSAIERTQTILSKSGMVKQTVVGDSACMHKLREQIATASQSDVTVMIEGETGVGKEVVATAIHEQSRRCGKALVAINCAAIPENLLESELFGYVKGAFSGADSDKTGLIALADGGTLFLDEIGDMPLALQAKLLRVLESRQFRPLGGDQERSSDFRLLAATHVALRQKIKEKTFRQDLFYRLYQFPIHIPPLREREDDVQILAKYFITKFNQANGTNISGIHYEVLQAFADYSFPGNVRELRNLIEFGCSHATDGQPLMYENLAHYMNISIEINSDSVKEVTPLDAVVQEEQSLSLISDLRSAVKDYELKIIASRLKQFKGNRSLAAESLGIPKRTLADKCIKMEIVE